MTDPDSPYTIWKNGGGRVGRFVTISPSVHVSEDSVIIGRCELYGEAKIKSSTLSGWCRVSGAAAIEKSTLSGFVNATDKTRIHSSEINGDIAIFDTSRVLDSNLTAPQGQQIRVVGDSTLGAVDCYGPVFVSNAFVQKPTGKGERCEIFPLVRILGGEWTRSPRIRRSPFQFHLIESHIEGNLLIGCWDKALDEWKQMVQIYQRIGNKLALASEAIQWDDGDILGGFEKMKPEELDWYANAISSW